MVPVLVSQKVDGQSQMTITTRTTNPVQVGLGVFREVKIDDYVDGGYIDTTSEQVRTNQVFAFTVSEIMEYTISVIL
jgi:hypothetical protein